MAHEIPFVGSWRLVSFAIRPEAGEPTFPFGRDAEGSLLYSADGRYSVHVRRLDRPRFADPDQMKGSPAEMEAAFKGMVSYYGPYGFDPERRVVTHVVEGSLFPNWEGTDQERFFELDGDRLTLRTAPLPWGGGGRVVAELTWERVR